MAREISRDRRWEDLTIGLEASFEHVFSSQDLSDFARISGDCSPLHTEEAYASQTPYRQPILHGLLTASVVSRFLGMHLPGRRGFCLSQTLDFTGPVYPGDSLQVRGSIVEKNDALKVVVIKVEVRKNDGEVVLRCKAQAAVRHE